MSVVQTAFRLVVDVVSICMVHIRRLRPESRDEKD